MVAGSVRSLWMLRGTRGRQEQATAADFAGSSSKDLARNPSTTGPYPLATLQDL